MRLTAWQQALEDYLLHPDDMPDVGLLQSLCGSPALAAGDGLKIYHHAYRARLLEVLRGDFVALHYWLGDEAFEQVGRAYLAACPPEHFSLRWLGQYFAEFLPRHLVAAQAEPLAELARLEWAFTLAFDAPDAAPLSLRDMAALTPGQWPELQLQLHSSVQWLQLQHNTLAIWQAAKAQLTCPHTQLLPVPEHCLVWRDGLTTRYRSLAAAEAHALRVITLEGGTFSALCSSLTENFAENAPLQAASWLKHWVVEGILEHLHS